MNATEDSTLEMLYKAQTELIKTYTEHQKELIRMNVPKAVLIALACEYELVMAKINQAIENQRIIDRMK